ncbi:MAG TPA: AMP-binding protein, partial [Acidimicrobiales bacterium]|nr:AMP-binding protein [Acidimicrobiales bacterium]
MNLAAAIESHTADAPALVGGWGTMTWGAVREEAAAWRRGLAELGVDPGDRVGIVAAASPTFVVAYLAVLGIGAVAVPLNPASPPAEVAAELAEVGARVVVGGPGSQDTLEALDPTAGVDHVAVPAGLAMPGAAVLGGSAVEGAPPPAVVPREAGDLAVLIFTSGTAGAPKPAMLTHGNLLANLDQVRRVPRLALTPEDRCLGVPPLFHIFGLNMVLGMVLVSGAAVVLIERFDPGAALAAAADHQVSVVVATPGVLEAWAGLGE